MTICTYTNLLVERPKAFESNAGRSDPVSFPEDTFVLLDALEQDAAHLKALSPLVCLEIGSGSGCVSAFLGSILRGHSSLFLATDINARAAAATRATGAQNNIDIQPVLATLTSSLSKRLRHQIDVLIFNPPYVPTECEESELAQDLGDIAGAWAGGVDGMQVTNALLEQVDALLSPQGVFYLVAVRQNKPQMICDSMTRSWGLKCEIALQRRAGGEHLYVIRMKR